MNQDKLIKSYKNTKQALSVLKKMAEASGDDKHKDKYAELLVQTEFLRDVVKKHFGFDPDLDSQEQN